MYIMQPNLSPTQKLYYPQNLILSLSPYLFLSLKMSTLSTTLVMLFLVVWASCVEDCNGHVMGHARKLLVQKQGDHEEHDRVPYHSFGRLVLGALPKGSYGSSAPSNKGHAAPTAATTTSVDEKLIGGHLAVISRILQSVPSPGAGH